MYEEHLKSYDNKTRATRTCILNIFKRTWSHGLQIQVKDVTQAQLELWLAPHKQRLKKVSTNEYIRFARQLFALAIKANAIAHSPAGTFKLLKPETPIRTTPSWPEFLSIVSDIRNQKFNADAEDSADLVEFMGTAGVGTAECANLLGEHIDFKNKLITLYRSKTDSCYTIPIFPQLEDLLSRLQTKGRIQNGQPVFRIKDPKKALAAAHRRLKMPPYSPRSLRRCFITRAIEKGVDFKTLASWQGHRDGGVLIAKTYSHLRNEHSDNMAKKLVA